MKKLLIILMLLIFISACTSKKEVAQIEIKDNNDAIILKVDDKNKLSDYLKDYKIENEDSIDLSKEGEHMITLITKDDKKINKNIIITANVEETISKEKDKKWLDLKLASIYDKKTEEKRLEEVKKIELEKKIEEEKKKEEELKKLSNTQNNTEDYKTNRTIYAENYTDGLDTSNHIVNFAKGLVGQPGLCDDIADRMLQYIHNRPEIWVNYPKHRIDRSEAHIGDIILYDYNPDLGYGHIATYLGNNLALHGNMGSANHTAVISSVDVSNLSNPKFYRMEPENMRPVPVMSEDEIQRLNDYESKMRWYKENNYGVEQCGEFDNPEVMNSGNDALITYCIDFVW